MLCLGAIWNFSREQGSTELNIRLWGTKGPFIRIKCTGTLRARSQCKSINQSMALTMSLIQLSAVSDNDVLLRLVNIT